MKDMIPSEELAFLARQNKEMSVEELLTEGALHKVKTSIEETLKTVLTSLQSTEGSRVTNVTLGQFEAGQGVERTSVYEGKKVITFLCQSMNKAGKHLFILPVEPIKSAYAYEGTEEETEQSLAQLSELFEVNLQTYHVTLAAQLGFQEPLKLVEMKMGQFEELETVTTFDLKQLCEVKTYQFEVSESSFEVIHLSDLDYMDSLYTRLHELFKVEIPQATELAQHMPSQKVVNSNGVDTEVYKPAFQSLENQAGFTKSTDLHLLNDIPLELSVVLGSRVLSVNEILDLYVGKVVELNKYADDPLEIYVNHKLIGEGEVVVVDENFGIKITKLYQAGLK